jgi:hypothetical protein
MADAFAGSERRFAMRSAALRRRDRFAKRRQRARLRPVQTSNAPPAAAMEAIDWPRRPPASPVCVKRIHARSWRPEL